MKNVLFSLSDLMYFNALFIVIHSIFYIYTLSSHLYMQSSGKKNIKNTEIHRNHTTAPRKVSWGVPHKIWNIWYGKLFTSPLNMYFPLIVTQITLIMMWWHCEIWSTTLVCWFTNVCNYIFTWKTFLASAIHATLVSSGKKVAVTTSTGIAGRQYSFPSSTLHRYGVMCCCGNFFYFRNFTNKKIIIPQFPSIYFSSTGKLHGGMPFSKMLFSPPLQQISNDFIPF